jgi:hypothetical protein
MTVRFNHVRKTTVLGQTYIFSDGGWLPSDYMAKLYDDRFRLLRWVVRRD